MFLNHFKLTEEPFGVTPDPRFLYLDSQHREALASLAYGTESNRGFLALIAKPGMGKTSLLYRYLESLRGTARTAYVFRTDCDSREFIRHVLLDLGIDAAGKDLPAMHEALNQVLVEEMGAGRRFVLVIDEAQNLADDVLESIRLLSNFETPRTKLMQIVIAGQPGLAEKLSRPSMAQLRQRISLVIRVAPLNREEIDAYIDHRLSIAGCKDLALFTVGARGLIAEHSEGIPRKINNICFNSMSLACALRRKTVDRATVLEALADLDLDSLIEKPSELATAGEERTIAIADTPQRLAERKKRWFQSWAPISAIAVALGLVAAIGVNYREVRAANPFGRIAGQAVRQSPVSAPTPTVQGSTSPSVRQEGRAVRIAQGQTLYRISVDNLGGYDPQVLEVIRGLNPWLSDPTNIPAGQEILLPLTSKSQALGHSSAPQELSSSLQETGKE
jgi:type II secretory pathway predicted ATPase ExeA